MAENDIRRILYRVGMDLWGDELPTARQMHAEEAAEEASETQEPEAQAQPVKPDLLRGVDETVEWTELMGRAPEDEKEAQLKPYADRVLRGDTEAYRAVLAIAGPLEDLAVYAAMTVTVLDDARADVQAETAALDEKTKAALAIRSARDLFALLPLTEVTFCGTDGLRVRLTRSDMRCLQGGFIDPAAFVKERIVDDNCKEA